MFEVVEVELLAIHDGVLQLLLVVILPVGRAPAASLLVLGVQLAIELVLIGKVLKPANYHVDCSVHEAKESADSREVSDKSTGDDLCLEHLIVLNETNLVERAPLVFKLRPQVALREKVHRVRF